MSDHHRVLKGDVFIHRGGGQWEQIKPAWVSEEVAREQAAQQHWAKTHPQGCFDWIPLADKCPRCRAQLA